METLIGLKVVDSLGTDIAGVVEYVSGDYAGIRDAGGRMDELECSRCVCANCGNAISAHTVVELVGCQELA